ncbi:hypothetical protein POPTR_012G115000v4 [Populus trichocarpa]|uniref:Cytochrome P450 n=5 Tax=Populus TaxID=3689 RepID=B9NAP5_POPTR|nr:hypothetical protein POPTR_012G115000v4 [Populus trichocarpa]|eukprot:XP_006376949.1 taxadiene 5-alpha hydroxylase [Populus trichocarpa]
MEAVFGLDKLSSTTVISLATLTTLVAVIWTYRFSLIQRKKLPPGKLGLPFIGESISFFRAHKHNNIGKWIEERTIKYGPVFKTSLMGENVVVMTGEASHRFIFSGRDNGIAAKLATSALAILGKNNIFDLYGSPHKLVRSAIMSFLNSECIQRYVSKMDSLVKEQVLQELNDKETVQVVLLMKKISFIATASLLFGLPEAKERDGLFKDFTIAVKGMWSIPLNLPGSTFRKAVQARGRIFKLFTNLIAERKRGLEDGSMGSHDDVILCLLSLRDENGKTLPDEEIINNLIALMMASHDTTSVLLSLIVRELAKNASVYDKVLEEQNEIAKVRSIASDGQLGWREIQKMRYTWNVAQELMRLTPPIIGNFRHAWRDTTFNGYDIPKGWQVFWLATSTHLDNKVFEDPVKFNPSRFDTNSKSSVPPYTYIPFGAGPRVCPGAEFARTEVLLIIHHLITNYKWTAMVEDEIVVRDPMPFPNKGLPVKIYPKHNI